MAYAPRPASPAISVASRTTYASAVPSMGPPSCLGMQPSPPAHASQFQAFTSNGGGGGGSYPGYYPPHASFPPSPAGFPAPGAAQLARQGSGGGVTAAPYDASSPYFVSR